MLKKILLFFILFFSIFGNTYGADPINYLNNGSDGGGITPTISESTNRNGTNYSNRDAYAESSDSNDDLTSVGFIIDTQSIFVGGKHTNINGGDETVEGLVWVAVDKAMMGLGVVSLLIMLIGAGYMIIYHGQDNLLSKGKTIFMAGIIALVVALSSQMMVRLVEYLIYTE